MQAIFDSRLMESFRLRAIKQAKSGADFLLAKIAEDLEERLSHVKRHFDHALDLYGHTGLAVEAMKHSGKVTKITRIETLPEFVNHSSEFRLCSRDRLVLEPGKADLIVSLLSLHLVNDMQEFLFQVKQGLKADGLFLAALCARGTLGELRESLLQAENELYGGAHPRIAPFVDLQDIAILLQNTGFAMPVIDRETIIVRYPSVVDLMADLRAMGMQNALLKRSHKPVSRRFFKHMAKLYAEKFSDPDGRIRASFSFIWVSGWSPHPDHQRPLKPGSAQISLTRILEDKSAHKTG